MKKKTITLSETAEIIGCSVRTLERMIIDGRFNVKVIEHTRPRRWNLRAVLKWAGER